VKITVNNLPENFAASLILDLFEYTRTSLEGVYSIELKDEETAVVILSTKEAVNFLKYIYFLTKY
jgi:hypothetical protein